MDRETARLALPLIKEMRAKRQALVEKVHLMPLTDIEKKDFSHLCEELRRLNLHVYGNKGRSNNATACITSLDSIKEQCNPRLAFNSCNVEHIGCPKCMETLEELANG